MLIRFAHTALTSSHISLRKEYGRQKEISLGTCSAQKVSYELRLVRR